MRLKFIVVALVAVLLGSPFCSGAIDAWSNPYQDTGAVQDPVFSGNEGNMPRSLRHQFKALYRGLIGSEDTGSAWVARNLYEDSLGGAPPTVPSVLAYDVISAPAPIYPGTNPDQLVHLASSLGEPAHRNLIEIPALDPPVLAQPAPSYP